MSCKITNVWKILFLLVDILIAEFSDLDKIEDKIFQYSAKINDGFKECIESKGTCLSNPLQVYKWTAMPSLT